MSLADRRAETYVEGYLSRGEARVTVEGPGRAAPMARPRSGGVVELYVKSIYEPSADEIPILAGILEALAGERLRVYEYEPIHRQGEPRHVVLGRYLRRAIESGRPAVVVMPSALPAGLLGALGPSAEALSAAPLIRVRVEHPSRLYLPSRGPVRLVAKRNSQQSYERVVWLRGLAAERGLRVEGEVYLGDNREILDYVFGPGILGALERVPVTKIASIVLSLRDCGLLTGLEEVERRDESTHLVYVVNAPQGLAARVARAVAAWSGRSLGEALRGLLHWTVLEGARRVMREVLLVAGVS